MSGLADDIIFTRFLQNENICRNVDIKHLNNPSSGLFQYIATFGRPAAGVE
jgi:hypothetical protein